MASSGGVSLLHCHLPFKDTDVQQQRIHGDIKPDNFLIQKGPPGLPYDFVPKITDFGHSHLRLLVVGEQDLGGLDRRGNQQYCMRNTFNLMLLSY